MTKSLEQSRGNYEIGYGKPPKSRQFKPGHVANPNGRPKREPTLEEAFRREGNRLVTLKSGQRVEKITKRQAHMRQLYNNALKGNLRASALLLQYEFKLTQPHTDDQSESMLGSNSSAAFTDPLTAIQVSPRLRECNGDGAPRQPP